MSGTYSEQQARPSLRNPLHTEATPVSPDGPIAAEPAVETALGDERQSFEPQPEDYRAFGSTLGLVELLLKRPRVTDHLARDASRQHDLLVRSIAIGTAGFGIYGLAMTLVLNLAAESPRGIPAADWSDGTFANLTIAYTLGLIAANGVCLPSFYFYGLLAGIRATMREMAIHAMKAMAAGALATIGLLPLYFTVVLGMLVFAFDAEDVERAIYLGLLLPFVAGLWGVRTLYVGICSLADTIEHRRRQNRECFLQRLVLCWCTCYTAVAPLMIYWLWFHFSA